VAEDVRALARSLAKDIRDSVQQSTGQAVRESLKDVAEQAREGIRTWSPPRHHHHRSGLFPCCWGWGRSPWFPPSPPPGSPGSSPGDPAPAGPSWQPYRGGRRRPPGGPHEHRERPGWPAVRHRWDAATVLGLIAVVFGVGWLLGAVHAVHVSAEGVLALGLMLLGASLIITARTDWSLSRRSWPVWFGAGLIVVLMATSSSFGVGGALNDVSFGDKTVTAANGQKIHGGFGNLSVDASKLQTGQTINVSSVAGEMVVKNLPPDVPLTLNGHVVAGQICVYGRDVGNGVGVDVNQTFQPNSSAQVTAPAAVNPITIDAHQVFGQIRIGTQGCH
jgi:Protein of unknown function, DUF417